MIVEVILSDKENERLKNEIQARINILFKLESEKDNPDWDHAENLIKECQKFLPFHTDIMIKILRSYGVLQNMKNVDFSKYESSKNTDSSN